MLPPTANLVEPNPYYDAETSPFRFIDVARPWPGEHRLAGVSAFGFGGTNFHAVLSSYEGDDAPRHGLEQWPAELVAFRAGTKAEALAAVAELAATVAAVIASDPHAQRHRLRDVAAAVCHAGSGPVQVALVADSFDDLAAKLELAATGATDARNGVFVAEGDGVAEAPPVAFLYPGQGSQRPGMASDLFVTFSDLGDLLDHGESWLDILFPPTAFSREDRAAQQAAITATNLAQPTLGIASLAATRVLRSVGVEPAMAGGHSYGELVALSVAGSFDEPTLLALSAARGDAILEAVDRSGGDPGTMAAVELTREQVAERLAEWPDIVLANHNGPTQAVISGPTASVQAAAAALEAAGTKVKLLPVACAFHSPVIGVAGELLAAELASVDAAAPTFPVWSNVTASPYPADDAAAVAGLLAEQVTSGVRFVDQIESMYAAGARVFVEAGPGRVLTQQVGKILGDRPHAMVATDVAGEHGLRRMLLALAELATLGVPVQADALFDDRAEPADLASFPLKAPGWTIDGAFIRTADGSVLRNSLQPANTLPALDLEGFSQMATGQPDANAVVLEYLRGVRQIVAAERDVMLRYLGSNVAVTSTFDEISSLGAPVGQPIAATAHASVAPAAAPIAAAVAEPAAKPALSGAELLKAVQAIVSERTGYPVEMLDPDLDLEADLSIDSIKRIEIVGELAERIGLGGLDESAVDEDMVEELASHKSLRGIVEWIEGLAADAAEGATPVAASSSTGAASATGSANGSANGHDRGPPRAAACCAALRGAHRAARPGRGPGRPARRFAPASSLVTPVSPTRSRWRSSSAAPTWSR